MKNNVGNIKENKISDKNVHKISLELDNQYRRTKLIGNEVLISLVGTIGYIAVANFEHKGMNIHRNIGIIPIDNSKANLTGINSGIWDI